MSLFTELRRELENYLPVDVIENIYQAYRLAAHAHKGQERHSGDPYITHPLAVAEILAQMRMDPETIMAAILHDVIEDTPVEKIAIEQQFGKDVAALVDGVSKLTQVQFRSRAEAQAESFRKMLLAMAKDIRVILIKLADRLHNMRTLGVVPTEKRHRIARETLDIYAPIARRLGMHAFRVEFEDLGFAALYPMRYRILQDAVRKARKKRKTLINGIETAIKEALEKHQLPPSVVSARQKHLYSIFKEMRDERHSLAEVIDVFTFCIVVEDIDTCYRAVGAIHNLYKPLPQRFRDHIAIPKTNGYQALHTTLFGPYGMPIEVQIRTFEMDNRADNGVLTHWLMHTSEAPPGQAQARAREWLKRLLDIQENTGDALEFIQDVKIDLFPEEIYVFTPQGKILELPRGATPIDFAYAIHSDIGDTCIAARVDRRSVPLSTPLSNGQTIEIITDRNAQPNPAWLNFVATGKAHSSIRHFLKNQRRSEAIDFGQRLLHSALHSVQIEWKNIPSEQLKILLNKTQCRTSEDLFEAIGLGHQNASLIAQRLAKNISTDKNLLLVDTHKQMLSIKGTEGMIIQFAECCRPIPGDAVVGIANVGKGISVHTANCPQITRLGKSPEKNIPVCWENDIHSNFKVDIHVEALNQHGVLAQLAGTIADAKANIDNVTVEEKDGNYCIVRLTISVKDRVHLARVMKRLRLLKTITRLHRGK